MCLIADKVGQEVKFFRSWRKGKAYDVISQKHEDLHEEDHFDRDRRAVTTLERSGIYSAFMGLEHHQRTINPALVNPSASSLHPSSSSFNPLPSGNGAAPLTVQPVMVLLGKVRLARAIKTVKATQLAKRAQSERSAPYFPLALLHLSPI